MRTMAESKLSNLIVLTPLFTPVPNAAATEDSQEDNLQQELNKLNARVADVDFGENCHRPAHVIDRPFGHNQGDAQRASRAKIEASNLLH